MHSHCRSHRDTKRPLRLYIYICETQYLDEVTVNELYNFLFGTMIECKIGGKNKTIKFLHSALLNYSYIMLYRDKIDGSLRGITTIGFNRLKEYTVIKMGPSFFKNHYKGGPSAYLTVAFFVLKELILHPFTPVYIVIKAIGYQSYMVALKFKESYPRYDRETPEHFKKILDEYARSELYEGDVYDEETNVIKQEVTHLPENLLAVSAEDLKNPHIKFFVERNPGYTKGHFLVAGLRMSWSDFFTLPSQAFKKIFRYKMQNETGHGRAQVLKRQRPKLLRRYTFMEESANAYAVDMYQVGVGGERLPTPTRFMSGLPSPGKSPMTPSEVFPHFKLNT